VDGRNKSGHDDGWISGHSENAFSYARQLILRIGAPEIGLTSSPVTTKPCFFIETDGARIVGIDRKIKPTGRDATRFRDQRGGNIRSPGFRRHHDLVEVARLRSTVTKPTRSPRISATVMAAVGTSSLRQRSRHQGARAAKSSCG